MSPARADGITIALIALAAAVVRIAPRLPHVFLPTRVNFQDPDAWYHVRLIEHLAHNFPHRLTVDPYLLPGGQVVPVAPLFDVLVATCAWAIGIGAPDAPVIETTAALAPALLGAAAIVPVCLVGRAVFDRLTGLLAGLLLALMPGPFLARTSLGVTDHHAAEVLLLATALLLLLGGPGRALLGGLAWGGYLLTWTSGALLGAILAGWLGLQHVLSAVRGPSGPSPARAIVPAGGVALALLLLGAGPGDPRFGSRVASVVVPVAAALVLAGLERAARSAGAPRWTAPAAAAALAGAAFLVGRLAFPALAAALAVDLARLRPGGAARTVGEVIPLLFLDGTFSLRPAWDLFRSSFFVGVAALGALAVRVVRRAEPGPGLVLVWSAASLAATLGQNRFGYYLSVNLALLAGWTCSGLLRWRGPGAAVRPALAGRIGRPGPARQLAVLAVAALVLYPGVEPMMQGARADTGMPQPWHDALVWLRTHTPEPFGTPGAYLATEPPGPPAHSVLTWWDHGYWVIRTGRRVPTANPTQAGAEVTARFLTATTETEAAAVVRQTGARYVIVSDALPVVAAGGSLFGTFAQVLVWAGVARSRFFETFAAGDGQGGLRAVVLFHPDYYRAMAIRLALLGTEAVEPAGTAWVVTYAVRPGPHGPYREIVAARRAEGGDEAERLLAALGPGDHVLACPDPLVSCVRLERLEAHRLVYESPDAGHRFPGRPSVRIYEVAAPPPAGRS